jgi:sulfur relay (sulfurtransferase) DsrC/TusE family protein
MKRVNTELILLYWEIGEEITRQQKEKGWGKSVVDVLAKELQIEFPGVKGFTSRNLWFMRQFYIEYSSAEFLKPLVSEIQNQNLQSFRY